MKFDSYARFIRSDMYKSCVEAESKNQPLPYPGELLDSLLRTELSTPITTKLKKSLSNAEDRRRKSLLPWHRKTRCKSKDRGEDFRGTKDLKQQGAANQLKVSNSGSDIHSSRSSLSSFDAAISSRSGNLEAEENRSSLCRVILSNGATTIVQTKNNETIRDLIERLLDKRGICYQAYEGFLPGMNKPLELDTPSISLAGKEVQIEQRVIFKLDLPNRKIISVKSKPCKALGEVLRPILHKYNYRLDLVQVMSRESSEPLDMTLSVTATDGQRLQVVCKPLECFQGEVTQISTKIQQKPNSLQIQTIPAFHVKNEAVQTRVSSISSNSSSLGGQQKTTQQSTLDEITNKVFNELLQGKVESHSGQQSYVATPTRASDQGSIKVSFTIFLLFSIFFNFFYFSSLKILVLKHHLDYLVVFVDVTQMHQLQLVQIVQEKLVLVVKVHKLNRMMATMQIIQILKNR